MDVTEYRERRIALLDFQLPMAPIARAWLPDIVVRPTPTDETLSQGVTLTPTETGLWRAAYWVYDYGRNWDSDGVTSATESAAVDWLWFACARNFRKAFVIPALRGQGADRAQWELQRMLNGFKVANGHPEERPEILKAGEPRWSDISTDSVRLGFRLLFTARKRPPRAMRMARNPATAPWALALAARSRMLPVRWMVAANASTPQHTLRSLRRSRDLVLRWFLAERPETPTALVAEWAREDPALWETALARQDLPSEDVVAIHYASAGYFTRTVIDHPSTPQSLLDELATDSSLQVRLLLLASGRLQGQAFDRNLERVTSESSIHLEVWIGRTPLFPLDADLVSVLAHSQNISERLVAAWSESARADVLLSMAADDSPSVRSLVARSSVATPEAVAVLAHDASSRIRENVAKRADLPPSLAVQLALDPNLSVRSAAGSNPSLTDVDLAALSQSPREDVARRAQAQMEMRRRSTAVVS